jgi:ATP-dependent helicase/nuclease subunit B
MTAILSVITGPPQSGKTERLLGDYRKVLSSQNTPNGVLWLSPTWRVAAEVRGRLLDGSIEGCFSPGVTTFEKFARSVLEHDPEPIRPINTLMKRQLIRRLIDDCLNQDRLNYFRPIARCGGLVDLLCDFIGELKRLEIWPEHFQQACAARGLSQKDAELLEIYSAYQQCLRENHLYDAEGLFWSARDWLGRLMPVGQTSMVVADGFTDFTRTQHEILEILARRADRMLVALPLESGSQRTDLFGKPLKTLRELQRRHARVELETIAQPERPAWPALAHLETRLFTNPRDARPAENTTGIEILAAGRQIGEIERIGARIKQMLLRGEAKAGEIVVVFRSLQDVGPLVSEVFAALGIPFALETGQTLDCSPALRALVALLQLDGEDWPAGGLLAVVGSNYFQPDWPHWQGGKALVALQRGIREVCIPSGRQRMIEQLAHVNDGGLSQFSSDENGTAPLLSRPHPNPLPRGEGTEDGPQPNPLPAGEGIKQHNADRHIALGILRRLAQVFDEMPQRAALADWASAWQRLAEQTGLLSAIEQPDQSGVDHPISDRPAWDRLMAALRESNQLDRWLGRHPPQLDRHEALAALLDIIKSEKLGHAGDDSGCVRVLAARSARGLTIPYLFVAGLVEKSFPQPMREDRFYSEADYQRLIDEGLPLVSHAERTCEEMLLFYEVITRATKLLHLSYPALDESAQPLSPSPYLREVEEACGVGRIQRTELSDLSPVPRDDEPLLSKAAFRVKAVATALDGNVALLAGLIGQSKKCLPQNVAQPPSVLQDRPTQPRATLPHISVDSVENLLAGLQTTHLREDRQSFSPTEGMCLGEAARAHLAAYYSPERTYSATELEQYASCPFGFFLKHWLHVEPIEELGLQIDFLERGRLVHELLAAFHRRVNQALGRPGSPLELEPEVYDRLLDESLQTIVPPPSSNPVTAALQEVDRRLLLQWSAEYRKQHESYDDLWRQCDTPLRPEFFEVSFGRGGEEPPSTPEPLELFSEKETVRVSGRIDRIDTGRVAGHVVFNVLDYKSGKPIRFNADSVAAGTTLQLPIYAMATAELLLFDRDAVPWQAGYWSLRDGGFKPRQALKMYRRADGGLEVENQWEEIRELLAKTVVALVCSMRGGEFPVASQDEDCTGRCPYRTVCRVNQVRSLEKTWTPKENN